MGQIRKMVRELIIEAYGIWPEVDMLADFMSKIVIYNILHYENINFAATAQLTITVPEEIREALKIRTVFVHVNNSYDANNIKNIKGGQFETNRTQLIYNNYNEREFDIHISLNLNWNEEADIKKELSSFFAHELHHAYTHIIRLNKKSKTTIYNDIKNSARINTQDLCRDNPPLKEFMDCFYLALPEEINARVQETYNLIKTQHVKSTEEKINALKNTRPWEDAEKLSNYNVNDLLKLHDNVLDEFVRRVHQSKDTVLFFAKKDTNSIKFPTNARSFFNYWAKKFNRAGQELAFKLFKNTGALLEIHEGTVMAILGEQSVIKITGNVFGKYNDCFGNRNEFDYEDYF